MRCHHHIVVLVLLASTLLSLTTEAHARSRKERDRKKEKTAKSPQRDANLCSMQGNSGALHCVCVGGAPPLNTTGAECWVFSEVTKDHGIWSLFATQPHITKLEFFVRPTGLFTFIPTKGLRHLNYLKFLQIMYANITEVHPYAFANSTTLTELTLNRDQIVSLDHHAFAHLTNLTILTLEENRIAEIHRNVFVDLPHLRKLLLARNNLSVIQEGAFRQLAHLLELELDSNFISVLTRDSFTGLGELKRLDLSYNKISMLGDLTFSELWVLEVLENPGLYVDFQEIFAAEIGFEAESVAVTSEDVAFLLYSSGTTGLPKAVELTHQNIVSNLYQIMIPELTTYRDSTATFQDVSPAILPFYHLYGLIFSLLHPLARGTKLVTLSKFQANTFINILREYKPTVLHVVPSIVQVVINNEKISAEDFNSVRVVGTGGMSFSAKDTEKLFNKVGRGFVFIQGYGMTEASPLISQQSSVLRHGIKLGGSGLLVPNTEAKIIPFNGSSIRGLGPNECGELIIRGPQVVKNPGLYINFLEIFAEAIGLETESVAVSSEDVAFLLYSSGTTGLPKAVELTHQNIVSNLYQMMSPELTTYCDSTATFQDVSPSILPFFHVYGLLSSLLHPLARGSKLVTLSKFQSDTFINILREYKPTDISAVPSIVQVVINNQKISAEDFKSLRVFATGGAPLGAEDIKKLFNKVGNGFVFIQGYGMTEASPIILHQSSVLQHGIKLGGSGFLVPNTEAKIIPSDGSSIRGLGPNECGELIIRGPQELNLEYNEIELISGRAFAGLNHLKKLCLSHNRLEVLSGALLGGVTTIVHLDLRSNHLETLTYDSVQPIIQNLRNESAYFYITDNRFICDCRLAWMHGLRNETKNPNVRNTLDEITCYMGPPKGQEHSEEVINQPSPTSMAASMAIANHFPSESHSPVDDSEYEYNEEQIYNNEEVVYDQQQDSSSNYVTLSGPKNPRMKHLFEIPLKDLPCPQKEHPTDSPRVFMAGAYPPHTPGYQGINLSSGSVHFTTLYLLVLLLILNITT